MMESNDSKGALMSIYLFLGALHELAHVAVAMILSRSNVSCPEGSFWLDILFFRRVSLDEMSFISAENEYFIRHAGWIFSLMVALSLQAAAYCSKNIPRSLHWAAWLTTVEALTTDLLQWQPLYIPLLPAPTQAFFFCGNFGIIFLHVPWYDNAEGRNRGLDLLQKMISITMMRGAQTGGVVTFNRRSHKYHDQLKGIQSRVVNNKRSDLSEKIRSKIESDALRSAMASHFGGSVDTHDYPKTYFGHTRFATSSLANFDGTHPHQWCPPTLQRVFRFDKIDHPNLNKELHGSEIQPEAVAWENFITHNGDLDFFAIQGVFYGLSTIQTWLTFVTGVPMPSSVDSAAIAGLVDLIHTEGCFGLSARYAILFELPSSKMTMDGSVRLNMVDYGTISAFFEKALLEILVQTGNTLDTISCSLEERDFLVSTVLAMLLVELREEEKRVQSQDSSGVLFNFLPYLVPNGIQSFRDVESCYDHSALKTFCKATVNAFFDNDLLQTTKLFLSNAKGSFGVGVTSSITAHRQLCLASRGQTISIAFYPKKGIVCYGSEQAATRAGLSFQTPGGDLEVDEGGEKAIRLDLDDLNGEVVLLDWGEGEAQVSPPNHHWPAYKMMNGKINVVIIPEGRKSVPWSKIHERMTLLEGHEFVHPHPNSSSDPVLSDICDIPRICRAIQDDWRGLSSAGSNGSLNRLTAWNLTLCLKKRLASIANVSCERGPRSIDILLTGCEVSLWLAEQFASDLQKAFPKMGIKAVSSNKLLGLFGQNLSVPALGYPMSEESHDMKDAIMIIVSQSGGTFGPLCCSNLMRSFSQSLFVITSEWDTQVAKQLRSMHTENDHVANSRIFATGCGFRTAEPSSVSVAATHQLLTNIFCHISLVIMSHAPFRNATGALVTERDLQELERCNQHNIAALEEIVGVDSDGNTFDPEVDGVKSTEKQLREAGDIWAEHVLEGAKAYIMLGVYVFVTVVSGYPLVRAIAIGSGLDLDGTLNYVYIVGFLDACIYFWFPQIAITVLRWLQGRNFLHRMVTRTVVIADIPWVSQAADSFLSKLFACSYSIAGLHVLSANPADHLVHRHTHRIVRGSLLLCGRPDGRLSALASNETSTCLAVNQACSIQSLGGTCEAVTIGHNPFKLPLSKTAIFLKRHRPEYLCERVLGEIERDEEIKRKQLEKEKERREAEATNAAVKDLIGGSESSLRASIRQGSTTLAKLSSQSQGLSSKHRAEINVDNVADERKSSAASSASSRSASALQGAYLALARETARGKRRAKKVEIAVQTSEDPLKDVVQEIIEEKRNKANHRETFKKMDKDGKGYVRLDEFIESYKAISPGYNEKQLEKLFCEFDGGKGALAYRDFVKIADMPAMNVLRTLQAVNRPRNLLQVEASKEIYFGETLRNDAPPNMSIYSLEKSQRFSMELYETRCASLQRFVSMTIMFHQLGKRVEDFFPRISFGIFGYRMDRSHSITRIQTTASPVSGADVRERIKELELRYTVTRAVERISFAWLRYRQNQLTKSFSRSQDLQSKKNA